MKLQTALAHQHPAPTKPRIRPCTRPLMPWREYAVGAISMSRTQGRESRSGLERRLLCEGS